jgi:hypothetical protein
VSNAGDVVAKSFTALGPGDVVLFTTGSGVTLAGVPSGALNSELTPSIDAAARSVFTVAPGYSFDFRGTVDGWYGPNNTGVTPNPDSITVTANNADPMLSRDSLSFSGASYDKVRVRLRRKAGSAWQGDLFYANGAHGESVSYAGHVTTDPTIGGAWVVVEWDMAKSSNPADWASGNVTHLRFDFGSSAQDVFEVDWIAIGRYAPAPSVDAVVAAQAAADAANAAITAISSDNVLSKGEKPLFMQTWNAITGEAIGIIDQSNAVAVDYSAYYANYLALNDAIPVGWNVLTTDTTIDGPALRTKFTNYYTAKQALLNAIAAKIQSNAAAAKSAADAANNALPGINAAIADKLSKTAANILQADVVLQAGGAVRVGNPSYASGIYSGTGVITSPDGIASVKNGALGFVMKSDGTIYTPNLQALTSTIGTLRTATSGARTEISDNVLKMFASNNVKILHLGDSAL